MRQRKLSGIYFRVQRDGKFDSIDFTDLTDEEREVIVNEMSPTAMRGMIRRLADVVHKIGDQLDIVVDLEV